MNQEIEIPDGCEAKIVGNKVVFVPKESENERIRKEIVVYLNNRVATAEETELLYFKRWITYLERQKEYIEDIRQYAYNKGLVDAEEKHKPLSTEETELNSIAFLEQLGYTCVPPGAERKPSTPEDIAAAYQMGLAEGRKEQKPAENPKSYDSMDDLLADALIEMVKESDLIDRDKKNRLVWIERHRTNPVEWSDNFEENIRELLHDKLTWHSEDGSMSSAVSIDDKTLKDIISGIWFYVGKEALKYPNKELSQPEWSEEDELMRDAVLNTLERIGDYGAIGMQKDWIKSLRPQPHWKPSEEQIVALARATNRCVGVDDAKILVKLLEQLKNL